MNVWETNLEALSETGLYDSWVARLREVGPWTGDWIRNKSGERTVFVVRDGKSVSIASVYDAEKEASRWAESVAPDSSVVVWGFCGVQAVRALFRSARRLAIVVEPRLELWRQAFSVQDWREIVRDARFLAVAEPCEEFCRIFARTYHPLWHAAAATHAWRAAYDEAIFEAYETELRRTIDRMTADFSTQARLAARWYRNTLWNLKSARPARFDVVDPPIAIVAGAGPSLEAALASDEARDLLASDRRADVVLLSTDTALPVLTAHGYVPDLVLCLDGQSVSYQHFIETIPEGTAIFADLSALPSLSRFGRPVLFALSNHPFSAAIRPFYPELASIDTSLGNVAGWGIRLAERLGARRTILWGQDFSYPLAKTYARGTYVYPYFYRRSDRLRPSDHLLTAFAFRTPRLSRVAMEGGLRYSNAALDEYRTRLENQAPRIATTIEQRSGYGEPLYGTGVARKGIAIVQNADASRWEAFSSFWKLHLERLPLPAENDDVVRFTASLSELERTAWLSLWPLALWIYRVQPASNPLLSPRELLDSARRHALETLDGVVRDA